MSGSAPFSEEAFCRGSGRVLGSMGPRFAEGGRFSSGGVDAVVFFGCVGAREFEDYVAAARVGGEEGCDLDMFRDGRLRKTGEAYVVDITVENHPAAVLGVVFRDFCRVDGLRHLELVLPYRVEHIEDSILRVRTSCEYINT